jgi:hypothetical protein
LPASLPQGSLSRENRIKDFLLRLLSTLVSHSSDEGRKQPQKALFSLFRIERPFPKSSGKKTVKKARGRLKEGIE